MIMQTKSNPNGLNKLPEMHYVQLFAQPHQRLAMDTSIYWTDHSLGLLTTSYGGEEGAEKAQKKSGKGRITKEIREMLTKNIPHSCQNVSN